MCGGDALCVGFSIGDVRIWKVWYGVDELFWGVFLWLVSFGDDFKVSSWCQGFPGLSLVFKYQM